MALFDGFLCGSYDISIGVLWGSFAICMIPPWDFNEIYLGFLRAIEVQTLMQIDIADAMCSTSTPPVVVCCAELSRK